MSTATDDSNKKINVHKDQCAYCFVTPEFPTGLLVCVKHKLSFCTDHVKIHAQQYQSPPCTRFMEYIRRRKRMNESSSSDAAGQNQPVPKITKLAIGVEGGVPTKQIETIEKWSVYEKYPDSATKRQISDKDQEDDQELQQIITAESVYRLRELESMANVWDGSVLIHTKHKDLKQLPFDGKVQQSGWTCQAEGGCDKRENLWMNLTDGRILCGRRYSDGSGGNNHAIEHYDRTKYPLAVNLGTITPSGADVYSYDEDEMVIDPNLYQHLAHFGIDMLQMEKTEKTMLEKDLDLNLSFEYKSILEEGKELKPVYGPGYVGIHNLGNSCYINSLIQAFSQAPEVTKVIVSMADKIFAECPQNPQDDVKVQTVKVFTALLYPQYSLPPENVFKENGYEELENGIKPYDFRYTIGKGHREFATKKQQDVEEYAHHLTNLIRLHFGPTNPLLPFIHLAHVTPVETGVSAQRYNLQCVFDVLFDVRKIMDKIQQHGSATAATERPKFNLMHRIREILEKPKTAVFGCVTRLCNFPPYLFIKVNRHSHSSSNKPVKLNYALEVDPVMDLNFLRHSYPRPTDLIEIIGHSASSKIASAAERSRSPTPVRTGKTAAVDVKQQDVQMLKEMGFSEVAAVKALKATSSDLNAASIWLMEKAGDPGLDVPDVQSGTQRTKMTAATTVNADALATLKDLGFGEDASRNALIHTGNNLDAAISLLCENPNPPPPPSISPAKHSSADAKVSSGGQQDKVQHALYDKAADLQDLIKKLKEQDGNGTYALCGIISHIGASTDTGHYVYHGLKDDGRWVLYNDEKVAISEKPPIESGYVYLFKRI